jgi:cell division protein FtsA
MANERLVVGIDVGTSKVCTLIARVTEDDQLQVVGAGVTRSDALRKGVVANVEQAASDIQSSVQKAEQQSGFKIISAYVGIGGAHIQTQDAHGLVTVRRSERPISEEEVARVLDAARIVSLPSDRELIDLTPRHFTVDGQDGISSPVGMLGHRLEVDATLVSGSSGAVQNLTNCVERAGVSIDALVPHALAAGESTLTMAERDLGVSLIDIGGGTTDLAVFAEGVLLHAGALPVGGYQVSNDLAVRLRTPLSAAEEIKIRYGRAVGYNTEEDHQIDVSSFEGESSTVSLRMLCETIEDRVADIFELVKKRLDRVGQQVSLPAGAVLVGGTAQLRGIKNIAADILESPVRVGAPSGIYGMSEQIAGPAFASSVGLLRWGLRHGDDAILGGRTSVVASSVNALINWLRSFLP